jgi:phosphoglycolate phosphatase
MYVGDDPRDIQAGNSAGMKTVIAKYGYITDPSNFASWESDYTIEHPLAIKDLPGIAA